MTSAHDPDSPSDVAPTLDRITVYPVKSLDPMSVQSATILSDGGLSYDREWALVDADGAYVNGKRERAVHRLRSTYDPTEERLRLEAPDWDGTRAYSLSTASQRRDLTTDLTAYFGYDVHLKRDTSGGFPDDTAASGPTLISAATVRTVAGWFDGIDPDEMRRRLRPNLVIGGVPAFWEDRLFASRDEVVAFELDGDDGPSVRLEGVNPCQRCVVPSRDPETGAETPGFRETFMRRREATMPEWSGGDWFDHYFRLMVNTRVPAESVGGRLAVGAELRRVGVRDA